MSKLTVRVMPIREIFNKPNEDGTVFRIVAVQPLDNLDKLDINKKYNNITLTGIDIGELQIGVESVVTVEKSDYPHSYMANLAIPPLSSDPVDQWNYLKFCITQIQYNSFLSCYSTDIPIVDYILDFKNHKDIINNVHGVGDTTLIGILSKINKHLNKGHVIKLLNGYEFTDSVYAKIAKHYDNKLDLLKKIINRNIYDLTEIDGVGFLTIDKAFLSKEGSKKTDENRIHSGIVHVLNDYSSSGHTTIKQSKLINKAVSLLDVDRDIIIDTLNKCLVSGDTLVNEFAKISDDEFITRLCYTAILKQHKNSIVEYNGMFSSGVLFVKEYYVMRNILYRSTLKSTLPTGDWDKVFGNIKSKDGIELSDEQKQLFFELHDSNLQFLVANGGTGKSMSQKVLLEYAKMNDVSYQLLAPTGKARKKLEEYTGEKAMTIHSFLIRFNGLNLKSDLYIIDESSMIDIDIVTQLFLAIDKEAKILFIGDDAQIPSVSCGNFLFDATKISDKVHVSKFTKVFRQNEGGILDIITKVRKGERFLQHTFSGRKVFGKNCVFKTKLEYNQEFSDIAVDTYIDLLKTYNEDDIVLLTPTNKGVNGTVYINKMIQSKVNPIKKNEDVIVVGGKDNQVTFHSGDLIMNIKNKTVHCLPYEQYKDNQLVMDRNYLKYADEMVDVDDIYIANGDTMKLDYIGTKHAYFIFEDNYVILPINEIMNGDIMHSWCITGHKSQGSEYKIVICIVPRQSAFQMNGNLLYTMMSRAKDYLLVLSDMGVFNRSLSKFENYQRETNLSIFLQKEKDNELYEASVL